MLRGLLYLRRTKHPNPKGEEVLMTAEEMRTRNRKSAQCTSGQAILQRNREWACS